MSITAMHISQAFLCINCDNISKNRKEEATCPICGSMVYVPVENWLKTATLIASSESTKYEFINFDVITPLDEGVIHTKKYFLAKNIDLSPVRIMKDKSSRIPNEEVAHG